MKGGVVNLSEALPVVRRGIMVKPSISGYWIEREAPTGWLVVDRRELGGRIETPRTLRACGRGIACFLGAYADREASRLLTQAVAKVRSVPPASLGTGRPGFVPT